MAKTIRSRTIFVDVCAREAATTLLGSRLPSPYLTPDVGLSKSHSADTGKAGNQLMKEKASPHSDTMPIMTKVVCRRMDFVSSKSRRYWKRMASLMSAVAVG